MMTNQNQSPQPKSISNAFYLRYRNINDAMNACLSDYTNPDNVPINHGYWDLRNQMLALMADFNAGVYGDPGTLDGSKFNEPTK